MKNIFIEIFDFFLPRFCPSCNNKLCNEETAICNNCVNNIKIVPDIRIEFEFERKFAEEKIISEFYSHFIFEKDKALQQIIHSFKYEKRFQNALYFGEILGKNIKVRIKQWEIDYIIPVPLHHIKKAERGYNQSYYIAKGISKNTYIPVKDKILKRKRFTESQTTMTLLERKRNIQNAFCINNIKIIEGKNILLVDDVLTTGATFSECGKVLLENGVNKVYAASVAIAD